MFFFLFFSNNNFLDENLHHQSVEAVIGVTRDELLEPRVRRRPLTPLGGRSHTSHFFSCCRLLSVEIEWKPSTLNTHQLHLYNQMYFSSSSSSGCKFINHVGHCKRSNRFFLLFSV
jgi:hypothetical protein